MTGVGFKDRLDFYCRSVMAVCLLLCLVGSPAYSATPQPITVVSEEYPPYNYTDASGQIKGVATKVVKEALERAGIPYYIQSYAWARAYQMALTKPDVLIYSIVRTPEREAHFKWVGVILQASDALYRLSSRKDIHIETLSDLKKYRIGAVRRDQRSWFLKKIGIQPHLVSDNAMNLKMLLAGRIDLFPIEALSLKKLCERLGIDSSELTQVMPLNELSVDLYMAFSKQTPNTKVRRLQAALEQIHQSGSADSISK